MLRVSFIELIFGFFYIDMSFNAGYIQQSYLSISSVWSIHISFKTNYPRTLTPLETYQPGHLTLHHLPPDVNIRFIKINLFFWSPINFYIMLLYRPLHTAPILLIIILYTHYNYNAALYSTNLTNHNLYTH